MSIALLSGCLCATAPTLLQSASSGMEVSLTTCLLLACLHLSLREQWLLAAALGFAAELARPEVLACLVGFGAGAYLSATGEREVGIILMGAGLLFQVLTLRQLRIARKGREMQKGSDDAG